MEISDESLAFAPFRIDRVNFDLNRSHPWQGNKHRYVGADTEFSSIQIALGTPIWTFDRKPDMFLIFTGAWNQDTSRKFNTWISRDDNREKYTARRFLALLNSSNENLENSFRKDLSKAFRYLPFDVEDATELDEIFGDDVFKLVETPFPMIFWSRSREELYRSKIGNVWMHESDQQFLVEVIEAQKPRSNWDREEFEEIKDELRAEAQSNVKIIPEGGADFFTISKDFRHFEFPNGTLMREAEKVWLLEFIDDLEADASFYAYYKKFYGESFVKDARIKELFGDAKASFRKHVDEVVISAPRSEVSETIPGWKEWIERKVWSLEAEAMKAWEEQTEN